MDKLTNTALDPTKGFAEGWQRAKTCQHVDAKWLCALFPNDSVSPTAEEVRAVLLTQVHDRRAMFLLGWRYKSEWLQQSAEQGYAPAQAQMAMIAKKRERFVWAEKAAAQHDRRGLNILGEFYWHGTGCEMDQQTALVMFKEAAALGHGLAQYYYGKRGFGEDDWQRYHWLRCAAARGYAGSSLKQLRSGAQEHLMLCNGNEQSRRIIFEIGATCKRHIKADAWTGYGCNMDQGGVELMLNSVALYEEWCACKASCVMLDLGWRTAGNCKRCANNNCQDAMGRKRRVELQNYFTEEFHPKS